MRWWFVLLLLILQPVNGQGEKVSVYEQGWLGIVGENMSPAMLAALGIEHGVLVSDVIENSPAAKSGFKMGDVITEFAGQPVDGIDILRQMVLSRPNQFVEVVVVRRFKRFKVSVKIGRRPGVRQERDLIPGFKFHDIYRTLVEIYRRLEPQLQTGKRMYQQSLDSIQREIERLKNELEVLRQKYEEKTVAK
ncbi:MAG: PDZ domain-containing protein [candidate division WOR-3 bacterium]|jgi:membrane-associated protease RseP (regulator of RpoE activity)|nr:PDZ domain-containing protein [candidate division WOR-3 bacterium]MDH7518706.1 PDZ domain-containing protein [bacterium]